MDDTPDYSKCSLRELHDVVARINQAKYPDRYALVLQEIERRANMGDDTATAKRTKPTARVLRSDVTYLIGGIVGFLLYAMMPFAVEMSPDTPDGMIEATAAILVGALLTGILRRIYLGNSAES